MNEQSKRVFIIMPSGNNGEYKDSKEEADYIYTDIISKAIKNVFDDHIQVDREIDNKESGAIDRSIVRKIVESDYAIVDITGRNPNVFFELGLRYALCRKTTILIRQADTPIPFDIGTYRCITYKAKYGGVKKAVDEISDALRIAKLSLEADSLVYNVYPNLKITFNNDTTVNKSVSSDMPWDFFWKRFSFYHDLLLTNKSTFLPDYVVGISNGGLFLSDTIYRLLYSDDNIPVISFWANRNDKNYFHNPFSNAVARVARNEFLTKNDNGICKMLVFDDVVDTGKTIKEFKNFAAESFPEAVIYYIPLFSRRKKLDSIVKDTIWEKEEFSSALSGYKFQDHCHTDYNELPYLKLINYNH